jgi:hypothetical protein
MNKQMHRFTAPLESDDWKQRLTEFLAEDDASLEAKYRKNDAASEPDPEPFYFVAPAVSEQRFAVPTNVLSALDALNKSVA